MANKVVVEIDVDTGEATKNVEDLNESIADVKTTTDDAGKSFSELGDVVSSASGGLINGFKAGVGAIRNATKGMKLFRAAVISTGVGALVVAIGSLVSYFQSTEEGAKKLKIATEFLSVIFSKLTKTAADLGGFIVSAFTEPQQALDKLKEKLQPVFDFLQDINTIVIGQVVKNFKQMGAVLTFVRMKFNELMGDEEEALKLQQDLAEQQQEIADINNAQAESWDDIKDAVNDTVDAVVDGFNTIVEETKDALDIAQRYADAQFRTRDLIQKLTVDNAKLSATIDEQQKKIDDTTRSYDERKEALDRQSKASAQLAENIALQAREEESLLKQQIAITSGVEEREELETQLADKIAQRIEAEKQVNIVNLENAQKTREIDREEFDRKRTILQQLTDLRLEANTNEQEVEAERLKLAEKNALTELDLLKATEEEKQQVRDYYAQIKANREAELKQKADEQKATQDAEELAKEKELSDAKLALTESTLGALSSLTEAFAGDSEASAQRQFKISKALSIAEATQNAYTGITTALAGKGADGLLPFPIRLANASIAGAMGLAQITKIARTKLSSTSTPSVSVGGGGGAGSAPTTPTLDLSALNTEPQQNIQAYVLDKTITQTQAQNQKIEEQANLVL